MEHLTIKEIAKMAGVSPTAVSFVLNGKGGVSEATRARVQAVINQTGFVPSANSKRLLLQKSFNIAILLNAASPFEDLFYFEVTRAILEKSHAFGYNVIIGEIGKPGDAHRLPRLVYSHDTDGIIFFQNVEPDVLAETQKTGVPFLVVDAPTARADVTVVNPDYDVAAYTATCHLLSLGHRRIGLMTAPQVPEFYKHTCSGYERAMRACADAALCPIFHATGENSARTCMEGVLAQPSVPTAMVCAFDMLALGAMAAVRDGGLSVPQDISFIGIDDILLASYSDPKLTTVQINKVEMGHLAMELIVRKINGEAADNVTVRSDMVIVRDSARQISVL